MEIDGLPAYFRLICWHGPQLVELLHGPLPPRYPHEIAEPGSNHDDIIRRIGALTKMNFFSSERPSAAPGNSCQTTGELTSVAITLSQSANARLAPDELVAAIARRLVEAVRALIRVSAGAPASLPSDEILWCARDLARLHVRAHGHRQRHARLFSDGGCRSRGAAAVARARLIAEGAEIIDIGGRINTTQRDSHSENFLVPRPSGHRGVASQVVTLSRLTPSQIPPWPARPCGRAPALSTTSRPIVPARRSGRWYEGRRATWRCIDSQTMQKNPHYADVLAEVGEFFSNRFNNSRPPGLSRSDRSRSRHRFRQNSGA